METKKTKKANIERFRGIFFECGLIVGLFFMIVAFNWSSSGEIGPILQSNTGDIPEEFDIVNTVQNDPPPPPEVVPPTITDELLIVDNTLDITSLNLFDPEKNKAPIVEVPYIKPKDKEKEIAFADDIPIEVVQDPPTMWDGSDANSFSKWVSSKIVYPTVALENRRQGKVTLQFRIGPDGSVGNIKVLRGVDPSLDKEAIRVVSSSPRWNPGKQHGKPVGVIYTFPVNFVIND